MFSQSQVRASRYSGEPFVESILCATDLSAAGLNAFAHALMMALTLRCPFTLFHVGKDKEANLEWQMIPGVRDVLERWGYLERGSSRAAVFEKVAVAVTKVYVQKRDVLDAVAGYIARSPVDLVVIGTGSNSEAPPWLRGGAAYGRAPDSRTMTMFVPPSGGFASMAHGGFTLRRVLVPLDVCPDPHPAITYAFRAAVFSSEEIVEMDLLRGTVNDAPLNLDLPERDYLKWRTLTRPASTADQIVRAAAELDADLISMTTGRGEITQIIRNASCPVLVIPVSG